MLATDRIDLLRLFVRIVETGQVSEAARSLGMSQPSASRCLARLETMLGTRLVQRSARGLALTPNGQAFLVQARIVLAAWEAAVDVSNADRRVVSGAIRVAVPVATGQNLLAAIASRFMKLHPGVTIEWHLRDDALDIVAGGYDLWIRAGELRRDDLVVREIYRIHRAIVAAAVHGAVDHPQALEGARAVRLSTFVPRAVALKTDDGRSFILRQKVAFTTDNLYAAQTAVLEGVGYAVLPLWLVQSDLDRGALVRSCPAWHPADVTLSVAYVPNPRRSVRIDLFLEYLRSELTREDGLSVAFFDALHAKGTVLKS